MKRIICTVSNDLTYDQRMIRICTSLAAAGYEVLLVGRELPNSRPVATQLFSQKRMRLWFKKGKFFYIELNLRLLFFLLFSKFDIVYSVDLDTLLPGRLMAIMRRKTCVFDAHEYFTELPELTDRPITKRLWEMAAKLVIPGLRHCITVCQSLADIFEKEYGVHFEVIRNVPLTRHQPIFEKKPKSPFVLIYQGALNDGRGLEESILAMKLLEGAELWICGEGDLSEALRSLVEIDELVEQVKFLGKLTPDELAQLTFKADLGLNLLKNKGLNYYYSLANKAFDYVQAGLPSLNMAFPEYVQINKNFGVFHLIQTLEPMEIAAAVRHLRSDKKAYDMLAKNCRQAAKTLNWQVESKKLLDFFEKLA
ncbi:MAG: glycosyltransferase family 4 protein [Saprospiraceae bacterium]|nr:glycosyltransferase family 4 protein [Saprospiraceae bacterium]MCF8248574.1 glycosyltransferase family 4 protein [Saprospiraceae bacterium]MCF8280259.1 glycosyltransferase family 4 protein [Bacteroidales bacterium]MCF8310307.1 glycosyltransferase family 4 protein [Saprospiraceae bacterium]MCF8439253.1 glycosyltransferase family 4 protein [Saprospiraceae bacterium]